MSNFTKTATAQTSSTLAFCWCIYMDDEPCGMCLPELRRLAKLQSEDALRRKMLERPETLTPSQLRRGRHLLAADRKRHANTIAGDQ